MRPPFLILLGAVALTEQLPIQAQPSADWKSCPVIATLPADLNWTEPLERRQRFQLRQCGGDLVIVTGYEKGKAVPSLVFDTGDGYPRYLAHIVNVLVFQSRGGASDHVYVFVFHNGKPSIALKTATKDEIETKQSGKSVTVIVPPPTYPGPDGKFQPPPAPKKHTFSLEY